MHPLARISKRSGFTLVEISIVIVIIGLLTASILVGRDLIHASQLRATVGQIEKYKTAVHTFKIKYGCVPGDCSNATSLGLGTSGALADNGDGDGFIDTATPFSSEAFNFWHHLSAANLIDGSFQGYTAQTQAVKGTDYPATKLSKGGVWMTAPAFKDYNNIFDPIPSPTSNSFWIANIVGNLAAPSIRGVLSPLENFQVDSKLDDGMPVSGAITISWYSSSNWYHVMDSLGMAFQMFGAGGPTANYCGSTSTTPASYNIRNISNHASTLCVLEIRGGF